jgi:Fur family peroxide stress response transcriptional regulator
MGAALHCAVMMGTAPTAAPASVTEKLATGGFRLTPQRHHVYQVLLDRPDHPTAEEVFFRAKETRPEISLATVYNCLDALVRCSLVKQVNVDRSATRFCPNMREHTHFFCEGCGGIFDLDLTAADALGGLEMPRGFKAMHLELSVRGLCRGCISRQTG